MLSKMVSSSEREKMPDTANTAVSDLLCFDDFAI